MTTEKKRFDDLDIAKCFGILLVYIGHCEVGADSISFDRLQAWIYSFHMPLFFFISGILFSNKNNRSFLFFLKKRIVSLILPYVFFSLFNFLILSLFDMDVPNFLVRGWGQNPLWFIPVLFACEIFHFVFFQKVKIWLKILSGACFVFLLFFHFLNNPYGPYCLATVPWFFLFYVGGFFSKSCIDVLRNSKNKQRIVLISCLVLHSVLFFIMCNFDMKYGLNIVCAFAGVFFMVSLSMLVCGGWNNIFLKFIGRNTMVILCTHKLYYQVLQKINYQEFVRGGENHLIVITLIAFSIVLYNRYILPLFAKIKIIRYDS